MRIVSFLASVLFGLFLLAGGASAAVSIRVDLSTQSMHVVTGSGESYDWPVSTARRGFVTPRGVYGVQRMEVMHRSHKYHNSPMPHSIFFAGGYAIHGTYSTGALGHAASHGCVRLSPAHAAELYSMVQAEGARISIVGSVRDDVRLARADHRRRHHGVLVASRRHQRGEPQPALGYAPAQEAPSFPQWLNNPADIGN